MNVGQVSYTPVVCSPDTGEFTVLFGKGTGQRWSLAIDGKFLDWLTADVSRRTLFHGVCWIDTGGDQRLACKFCVSEAFYFLSSMRRR